MPFQKGNKIWLGRKHSEETKRKLSEKHKGTKHTEKTKRKLSEFHKKNPVRYWLGKKQTEEHIRKRIETRKSLGYALPTFKGRRHTEEARKKIGDANRKRVWTEEAKKKISEAHKGNRYMFGKRLSEETKRKIAEALKGRISWNKGKTGIYSEETLRKMSKVHKGKKLPEEHKRNIGLGGRGKKHSEETKKKIGEAQKREKHHNWQGGISFEPYGLEFNEDLKEVIRNRDRRKCFLCGKTELECGEKLTIHHIDYCKTNNNPNNLISLCRSCNGKVNFNRKKWQQFFVQNVIVKI